MFSFMRACGPRGAAPAQAINAHDAATLRFLLIEYEVAWLIAYVNMEATAIRKTTIVVGALEC